jgi:hypothetical protein
MHTCVHVYTCLPRCARPAQQLPLALSTREFIGAACTCRRKQLARSRAGGLCATGPIHDIMATSTSFRWGVTDRENVDPLTGHLSTLPAGSGAYAAAPSSKKTGGGQATTMLGRLPLSDLTDLFSQQVRQGSGFLRFASVGVRRRQEAAPRVEFCPRHEGHMTPLLLFLLPAAAVSATGGRRTRRLGSSVPGMPSLPMRRTASVRSCKLRLEEGA